MDTSAFKVVILCLLALGVLNACEDGQGGSSPGNHLDNSFNSVEKLTEKFLEAAKDEDFQTMELVAADQEEFERLLWHHLPASKPGTNLTPDFVWNQSQLQSLSSLRSTVRRLKGKNIELIRVVLSGDTREYGDLKLLMEPEAVISIDGNEEKVQLFGAIMILGSEYKVYSYSL